MQHPNWTSYLSKSVLLLSLSLSQSSSVLLFIYSFTYLLVCHVLVKTCEIMMMKSLAQHQYLVSDGSTHGYMSLRFVLGLHAVYGIA